MSVSVSEPLSVKLRIKSWAQLHHLYTRDISKSQLFLKSSKTPPLGTKFQINLLLPSDSTITLAGRVDRKIEAGGLEGRGPGVLLRLDSLPYTAQWLIESSLASAAKSGALGLKQAGEHEPSVDEGRDEAAAEDALVESMREELEGLRKLNPFQVLELGYDASTEDVHKSFAALTKKYHPDRFARFKSDAARLVGSEIYLCLRDAYQALKTDEARRRTMAELDVDGAPKKPSVGARPQPTAAVPPPVPKAAPPVPTPAPPIAPARPASAAPPASAPPHAAAPSAVDGRFNKLVAESKFEEALKLARVGAVRNPSDKKSKALIEVCEGLRALAQGDRMEAAQRFEATLELDPGNEHAIRAVAELRRRATEERRGFLGRLLNKKD